MIPQAKSQNRKGACTENKWGRQLLLRHAEAREVGADKRNSFELHFRSLNVLCSPAPPPHQKSCRNQATPVIMESEKLNMLFISFPRLHRVAFITVTCNEHWTNLKQLHWKCWSNGSLSNRRHASQHGKRERCTYVAYQEMDDKRMWSDDELIIPSYEARRFQWGSTIFFL